MLAEMGLSSIPSVLPVPRVQDTFDVAGRTRDERWIARADTFVTELEWYAEALCDARVKTDKSTCPEQSHCDATGAASAADARK